MPVLVGGIVVIRTRDTQFETGRRSA